MKNIAIKFPRLLWTRKVYEKLYKFRRWVCYFKCYCPKQVKNSDHNKKFLVSWLVNVQHWLICAVRARDKTIRRTDATSNNWEIFPLLNVTRWSWYECMNLGHWKRWELTMASKIEDGLLNFTILNSLTHHQYVLSVIILDSHFLCTREFKIISTFERTWHERIW